MAEAHIRLYQASDEKLVKFSISKAAMEGLAVANRRTCFNPFILSVWVGLSCTMIGLLDWWPKPELGLLGYLSPLPAFGCWGAVMIYLLDWFNRPCFEDACLDLLRRPDVADIEKYYRRSPSSGLFILENSSKFVGLIAIDASVDSQSKDTLMDKISSSCVEHATSQGTSSVATIRHFYVDEPYRSTGIQEDLLAYAAQHAFNADDRVKNITATATSLVPYSQRCLLDAGFVVKKPFGKMGIFGWQLDLVVLQRAYWERRCARTMAKT